MRIVLPAAMIGALFMAAPVLAAPCASLTALKLPATTITAAEVVPTGAFRPPGLRLAALPADELRAFERLPAFCRVQGVIAPSSDSHIEFEVWMPLSGWNGRYLGVGNGGFAGSLMYWAPGIYTSNVPTVQSALMAGYATSSTDTGHDAPQADARWALGHREKIIDYGYRAVHETAETAKAIIRAFYRRTPAHSYFDSCSNGGRQGLIEAQRYPADYDGVIAGAPAASFTHLVAEFEWDVQATEKGPASYIPANKWPAVQAAVLEQCDALDGLKDGLIEDPRRCDFKPNVLLCHGPESPSCLTALQITALEKIYAGPRDSQADQISPGLVPGGEAGGPVGWALAVSGPARGQSAYYGLIQGFADLMQNPHRNFLTANVERDADRYGAALGHILSATNPDLTAFEARGGKLILFHGWSDPLLSPLGTVDYYDSVVARMGRENAERFTRLYMVPGMPHCFGGSGPNTFGTTMLTAVQHWVEKGVAPQAIVATKYRTNGDPASGIARTRPLCPYPEVARYKGTGSIDVTASFTCRAP